MEFLYIIVILLVAAIIAVPIARKLGLGSVLGYLAAGLLIGPAGLSLVGDVKNIAHVSELGVVMLLFVIGLELRPARLWVMRRSVLGLGSAQVFVTATVLCSILLFFDFEWTIALVIAFALALSSTAMVLPLLAERELLTSHAGRDAFSVLLFQDIAVIPVVALIPALQSGMPAAPQDLWQSVAMGFAALLIILIGGRYLIRPVFRIVERAKTPEMFTATTLAVVIGTAALVDAVGLSMSLGAFIAGVLLADSEYRHQLRADIEPFEGLLLGVFIYLGRDVGKFGTAYFGTGACTLSGARPAADQRDNLIRPCQIRGSILAGRHTLCLHTAASGRVRVCNFRSGDYGGRDRRSGIRILYAGDYALHASNAAAFLVRGNAYCADVRKEGNARL